MTVKHLIAKKMKISTLITTLRGVRCVKFKATIGKNAKKGIPKRHQKTWSFETCAPEFTTKEMTPSVEKEAKRWEEKVLKKYQEKTPEPVATEAELVGVEDEEL